MRKSEIANRLSRTPVPPTSNENLAQRERIAFLSPISRLYEQNEVLLDGRAPSLHDCCPDRAACWAKDRDRVPTGGHVEGGHAAGGNGSIFWPWIGSDYRRGGLCIVGWNLRHEGSWWAPLVEEYVITARVREEFEAGRKRHRNGGGFGYGAMASAQAILASSANETPEEKPSAQSLIKTLDQVARVQTVKCAPLGNRSHPRREMVRRCPTRFFLKELTVFRPGALLALGVEARDAITQAGGEPEWKTWQQNFQRGTMEIAGHHTEVFVVPHPGGAWALWPDGQRKLVKNLRRVGAPGLS
jgi:uracil DNA glycosylase superfamily protein